MSVALCPWDNWQGVFPLGLRVSDSESEGFMAKLPEQISILTRSSLTSSVLCLVTQSCLTLCNAMDCSPPGSSVHGDSPGKNPGVSCHVLLQGIFPIQESNPGLPSLQADFLPSELPGKPPATKGHLLNCKSLRY